MTKEKIFITGATGCIGHYLLDHFLPENNVELHLLVRNPNKLKINWQAQENIRIHHGDLDHIDTLADILSEMDYLIHIATNWDDSPTAFRINVEKTLDMLGLINPEKIKKIAYFSTASILGPGTTPTLAAKDFGSGYVRSKYCAYETIRKHPLKDKIVTLFPTLVFGGDNTHPYSHISEGLDPSSRMFKLLRFFYLDSAFHFMHSWDIAAVTKAALMEKQSAAFYVLGQPALSGKEAIRKIALAFNIPLPFQIKIPVSFILLLARLFRIHIDPWTLHCLNNPFFRYSCVTPQDFGIPSRYSNLEMILAAIKQNKTPAITTDCKTPA